MPFRTKWSRIGVLNTPSSPGPCLPFLGHFRLLSQAAGGWEGDQDLSKPGRGAGTQVSTPKLWKFPGQVGRTLSVRNNHPCIPKSIPTLLWGFQETSFLGFMLDPGVLEASNVLGFSGFPFLSSWAEKALEVGRKEGVL